jgi:hypothetical protein
MSHTMLSSSLGFPTLASSIAAPRASSRSRLAPPSLPRGVDVASIARGATLSQRASFAATGSARAFPAASPVASRPAAHRRRLVVRPRAKKGDVEESTANISKKVQRTANACQLVLSTVSAVILVFSFLFKGITKATDAGLYFILFGIVCGYFTTFWSLGVGRLGNKLQSAVQELDLVPPRADVVRQLSTGLTVNFIGLGATIIGLQATTGVLFAKSLSAAAAAPFSPGGYNPVLALDIFLIQAGGNCMLAHWIGAAVSLWLLRTVNLPTPQK